MNKYNSESYGKQAHKPAKRAVEGDIAIIFSPVFTVQMCLIMAQDGETIKRVSLFSSGAIADDPYRSLAISIDPPEEVMMQAKLQREVDEINAATLGIRFNQLFKKK